jgi:hypothetical protein
MVGLAPRTASTGPPTSIPPELAALTTTLCPARRVRRCSPVEVRVMEAVTPALPTTTHRPATKPAATMTGTDGSRPITTQQQPVTSHAAQIAGRTGSTRRRRTTPRVLSTQPNP